MMADDARPEIKSAILTGAIAEGVLFAAAGAIWLFTGEWAWLVGAFIIGSALWLILLARAGAFTKRDE